MFIQEIKTLSLIIIESVERKKQPLIYWLFSLVAVIVLRMYLEDFSSGRYATGGFFSIVGQLHEFLFFIVIFSVIVFILAYFTKERIEKILKIIIAFSPIILVAPIIDLIVTAGKGLYISYIYNFNIQGFWWRFFTLGGTWRTGGATPGIKIEILFVLAFIFLYILVKTNKKLFSLLGSFIFYCCLIILATLPVWVQKYFDFSGYQEPVDPILIGNKIFILCLLILLIAIYWRNDKNNFKTILQGLRVSRILFYLTLFSMGFILALVSNPAVKQVPMLVMDTLLAVLAVILSSIFLMMVNDKEDLASDKLTAPYRILPSGKIDERSYFTIGLFSFALALAFAAAISLEVFFLFLLGNLLYVIYSVPPFRIKKIFLLSKVVIAVDAVIVMTIGYFLNHTYCSAFLPTPILLSLFLGVFTCSHVIDLKDYEGDKAAGIKTLPVLFGLFYAKVITSLLFIVSFIIISLLLGRGKFALYSLIPSLLVAVTLFKKPYSDRLAFLAILVGLLYFSVLYLFF